jgi:hypothetical protein
MGLATGFRLKPVVRFLAVFRHLGAGPLTQNALWDSRHPDRYDRVDRPFFSR